MKDTIIVVGSGVAGLRAAIELLNNGFEVLLFSKREINYCNTDKAQGGIAVVLNEDDSFEKHIEDTLKAGAGLCRRESVEVLVKEGPKRVEELIEWGANFDKDKNGRLDFTKEAAHSVNRILHALGDATGHEIERTLIEKLKRFSDVRLFENRTVVKLLIKDNRAIGILTLNTKEQRYETHFAKAVILATGGYAAIYKNTTNPEITTGDGITIAFLAGAELEDMEFVQFHPTALKRYNAPQFLISESMRGEGAILINDKGERFMEKYHRLKELAPRDVVARSIIFEMKERGIDKVYLDATKMGAEFIKNRFPTIYNECLKYGLDITKEAIPVAPAAHYTMGGIKSDINGKTNIDGLFVAGETACNGVHGANRLASNSMLEGLVFGKRAADSAMKFAKDVDLEKVEVDLSNIRRCNRQFLRKRIADLRETIFKKLGVVRRISEMEEILECSWALFLKQNGLYDCEEGIILRNISLLASVIAYSGISRKGSIGAHYCVDTPHAYENKEHITVNIEKLQEEL